jgi:4-hydroxybenzoate polyprenyltransferase
MPWWKLPNPVTWLMTIAEIATGVAVAEWGDLPILGGVIIGLAMGTQLSRIMNQLIKPER